MRVLLLTPPMVQLNTPYPATPVLTAFLEDRGVDVRQEDLSLETALRLFTKETVQEAFKRLRRAKSHSAEDKEFLAHADEYAQNVGPAVEYLQGRAPELAWTLSRLGALPAGPHFLELMPDEDADPEETLDALFGPQGIESRAKMLASLFLDDLADLFRRTLDPDFAFARYAEHLAVAAPSFTPLRKRLRGKPSYVDGILDGLVAECIRRHKPDYVGITVPFPGTVYAAFRTAQTVKKLSPKTKTILGGGYVNTELRDFTDDRVFDYFDFITYDEGFAPLLGVLGLGPRVRTRTRTETPVLTGRAPDVAPGAVPVRRLSYRGLDLGRYLSLVESCNPMHRLWSDGRWLKVQIAAGCYWHRCRFCDVALDYIGNYRMPEAKQAVDMLVRMREETGVRAFHFTDEAVPPALLREISAELLRRGERIAWWGNIRFDRAFTPELARLMAQAGCVGVTGGLECAHDRLLKLMDKGIDCATARATCEAFAEAGLLVHAYLMYGYPTQTKKETMEALDFVRSLFADGCLHSAYWHRFALTVHSPIAKNPPKGFRPVVPAPPKEGLFALNEIPYAETPERPWLAEAGRALSLAVHNFQLGRGLDRPASFWFRAAK